MLSPQFSYSSRCVGKPERVFSGFPQMVRLTGNNLGTMIQVDGGIAGVLFSLLGCTNRFASLAGPRCLLMAVTVAVFASLLATAPVRAETRSLSLYFVHTKERATITFKKNGRYNQAGLKKLNRFLRDWRQKESTKMDPRLFDLLWEVYQASGSKKHIHVVSAYRSPKTNALLRKRSRGVAKKSQHIRGRAMDFYLPDVPIKKLRRIGMKFQVGGVGYYPKSGSPFVHLDIGSVRSWPRMNRRELSQLFPKGKTLHLPSDGKPLPGYKQALADYKSRVSSKAIQVAGGGAKRKSSGGGNVIAGLFNRKDKKPDPKPSRAQTQVAAVATPVDSNPTLASAFVPNPAVVPRPEARPNPPDAGVQVALAQITTEVANAPQLAPQSDVAPRQSDSAAQQAGAIPEQGGVPIIVPGPEAVQDPVAVAALDDRRVVDERRAVETALLSAPLRRTSGTGDADVPFILASVRPQSRPSAVSGDLPVPSYATTGFASKPLTRADIRENVLVPSRTPENVLVPSGALAPSEAQPAPNTSQLAYVPLPTLRPDFAGQDTGILTASLDAGAAITQTGTPAPGMPIPTPSPLWVARNAPEMVAQPPVQIALAPTSGETSQSDSDIRANAFLPAPQMQKSKGGRPRPSDAAQNRPSSLRQEAVWSQNMMNGRTFDSTRVAALNRPVSAPEFVSHYMRSVPSTIHVEGFSPDNRVASADQFSGRAVNFMTVARFETRSQ